AAWAARQRDRAQLTTLCAAQAQAQAAQAQLRAAQAQAALTPVARPPDYRVEVFVNMARRMQSLLYREIQAIDEIESRVEDPGLLQELFTVDHLATRMRRYTESLAVLGGAVSRRRWSSPVPVDHVLRAAVAETEHYARVSIAPPVPGMLRPEAVADVIHLVAELIENATKFSPPGTQVVLRVGPVAAGLSVDIEDRGLGMDPAEQRRINGVLAARLGTGVGELLSDGRIGIYVVSALARRHAIAVELQRNVFGGTQAVIVLPPGVAYSDSPVPAPASASVASSASESVPAPVSASASSAPFPAFVPAPVHEYERAPERVPEPAPWPAAETYGERRPLDEPPLGEPTLGERPPLPRRSAGDSSYMAAPLRPRPARAATPQAPSLVPDGDEEPDPGLMASFRHGFRRAAKEDTPDASGRSDPPDTSADKERRTR
ncbi:MAG: ATP-binding protein, partial [Trebonia sp.]